MPQHDDSTFTQAGKITVREGKKGIEFYAFNHQRRKQLHIGTLAGSVYEKTAPILEKPERSFCLPQSELAAIEREGGQFIRFIARGAVGTYAISLEDFKLYGERYFNPGYGPQIRVPLTRFPSHTPKVQKRNSITDNPPLEVPRDIIKPREKQLTLNGWGM